MGLEEGRSRRGTRGTHSSSLPGHHERISSSVSRGQATGDPSTNLVVCEDRRRWCLADREITVDVRFLPAMDCSVNFKVNAGLRPVVQ